MLPRLLDLKTLEHPAIPAQLKNVNVIGCLAFCPFLLGCGDSQRPIGGDRPVTTQRLTGARLTDIRDDVSWTFAESTVVIENKDRPIPSDLVDALLKEQSTPTQIAATWQLNEETGVLRLSSMEVDGEKIEQEVTLSIRPAGNIRVNLDSRQYNVGGAAKEP